MEGSGLPNGYCLYGDNAYVNETYMSVPFPNTSSSPRDPYNYYQSQLRINIECALCFNEPLAFTQISIKCKNSHHLNQCIDTLSLQNTQFLHRQQQCQATTTLPT